MRSSKEKFKLNFARYFSGRANDNNNNKMLREIRDDDWSEAIRITRHKSLKNEAETFLFVETEREEVGGGEERRVD